MKRIEQLTTELITEHNLFKLPVDVSRLAKLLSVKIRIADLGKEVSSLLYLRDEQSLIGINQFESKSRQNFAIAHELGHFLLHSKNKKHDLMFISKVHFRDIKASNTDNQKDHEANEFAYSLLMPESLILDEIENLPDLISAEDATNILAKKFKVTPIKMFYRIQKLKLFT